MESWYENQQAEGKWNGCELPLHDAHGKWGAFV